MEHSRVHCKLAFVAIHPCPVLSSYFIATSDYTIPTRELQDFLVLFSVCFVVLGFLGCVFGVVFVCLNIQEILIFTTADLRIPAMTAAPRVQFFFLGLID